MKNKYIAIEGNIGVGKTTLAKILSARTGASLILEKFRKNHFLPLFYNDMERYGLHVELSFLIDRIEDTELFNGNDHIISDYFFSKTLLFARANLDKHAFRIFERVYLKFEKQTRKPDLILYLYRDVKYLLRNITERGRKDEANITIEYLTNVQKSYNKHFAEAGDQRILSLDISNIDFKKSGQNVDEIIKLINKKYKMGITNIKM